MFSMLLLPAAMIADVTSEPVREPNIEQLGWMIGDWTFVDRSLDPNSSYVERGTRSCDYYLDRRYIRCLSTGTAGGKTRDYVMHITYNEVRKRFEILSLFGNIPEQALDFGTLSQNGHRLDLQYEGTRPDGKGGQRRGWAFIVYNGTDQYIWNIGGADVNDPENGPVRFQDVVTRVKQAAPN